MKRKSLKLSGLVFVMITALTLSSCSKKSTPEDELVGNWTIKNGTYDAKVGTKPLAQYVSEDLGLSPTDAQLLLAFINVNLESYLTGSFQIKSDHTYTSTLGGTPDSGTWSLSSDNKTLTIDPSQEDPFTIEVVTLTSSSLELRWSQPMEEDLNQDGTPETLNVNIDLTFQK